MYHIIIDKEENKPQNLSKNIHTSGSVKPIWHKTYPIKLLQYLRFLVPRIYKVQVNQFLMSHEIYQIQTYFHKMSQGKKIKLVHKSSTC